MPPDFHRATLGDDISMNDYNWSPDGSRLALASVSRDHKRVVLRVADTATGAVRDVFEETVATQFESRAGWRVLWRTNEVVWHSERDNWGQLYLYDLQTGRLKHAITTGDGPVMQIVRIDETTRTSGSARTAASLVRIRTSFTTTGPVSTAAPSCRSRRTMGRTRCSCRLPAGT